MLEPSKLFICYAGLPDKEGKLHSIQPEDDVVKLQIPLGEGAYLLLVEDCSIDLEENIEAICLD